jgi:hypothetical protein
MAVLLQIVSSLRFGGAVVNKAALLTISPQSAHPGVIALLTDALSHLDVTIIQLTLDCMQSLACDEMWHPHIAAHKPL